MRRLGVVAVGLLLASGTGADPSYEVVIDEGFRSEVSVEEIVRRAEDGSARAIRVHEKDGALEVDVPPPAVIHAVYGCRGKDLPKHDPRIGATTDEWVWAVVMTGNFSLLRHGTFRSTEGFVLFHPVSGLPFRSGVFAARLEDAR